MRIIFVRHGHPDYKNDCLTPLGHEQAKAAAARLQNEKVDAWLSGLGYDREGEYYRVREANDQTIMLVSHGGSSSCVLSHLFNLPLPFVLKNIPANLTGITVVKMAGDVGSLISPKFEMVNDARHIQDVTDPTYDN